MAFVQQCNEWYLVIQLCAVLNGRYEETPPTKLTLKCGDAVVMDTRVMHCGGANK